MVYLGVAPGNDANFLFMHSPNNVLFTAAQAEFLEAQFPQCDKPIKCPTRVPANVPAKPPIEAPIPLIEDSPPPLHPSSPHSRPVMPPVAPTPVRQPPAPRKQRPPPPLSHLLLTILAKSTRFPFIQIIYIVTIVI